MAQALICLAAAAVAADDFVDPHAWNVLEVEKSALRAEIIDGVAEDTATGFTGTYA